MRGTTIGKYIFDSVVEATSYVVPLTKLSAVCTPDGALTMNGIGLVTVSLANYNKMA